MIKPNKELFNSYSPGLLLALIIGLASLFLSNQYSVPAMLMALLLGLAFHFLDDVEKCKMGLKFAARFLLRAGVALLGLSITLNQVSALGWQPLLVVIIAVITTILFGIILAKLMGFDYSFGALSGGSVAICGASAAMAISSILPNNEKTQKDTLFTIIGVTTLSTFAMVFYPILVIYFGLSDEHISLFLGATIHDVAQVTGAGYSLSPEIGDLSTFYKLLRVAMLVPIVLVMGYFINRSCRKNQNETASVKFPLFLIAFILLFLINSFINIPPAITQLAKSTSSMFLLTAVAALGVQTSLKEITKLGIKPIILIVSETIFISVIVLVLIQFL